MRYDICQYIQSALDEMNCETFELLENSLAQMATINKTRKITWRNNKPDHMLLGRQRTENVINGFIGKIENLAQK